MADAARLTVDGVLDDALRLPAGERLAFVRAQLHNDPALLEEAEAVLREDAAEDGLFSAGAALRSAVFAHLCRTLAEPEPVLAAGTRVGPYVVAGPIGRGGMGEVYRARDPRLGRDVALKVLPRDLQESPDRLSRFRREAQVLASLNHPRIASIYDVIEVDDLSALVLEFVDGPTLGDRLASGPLALPDALSIARDLGEALDAAHARGVVHRDLKPHNVKLTADGHAKVLDFGLAKALSASAGGDPDVADEQLFETMPGTIVGTTAYMAPEQARGEPVDHRADIWAFGCIVYEMLTGVRFFDGRKSGEPIERVLDRDEDLVRLPATTPSSLRRLVQRCLARDLDRRLTYAGDALLDIDAARHAPAAVGVMPVRTGVTAATLAVALLAGLLLGGGAGAWILRSRASPAPTAVTRFSVTLPGTDAFDVGNLPGIAISPDGQALVYRARRAGTIQLFVRAVDNFEPVAIPGTTNGTAPFFSPDGRWVGFDQDGVLMKVPPQGGPLVKVANAPGGGYGAWAPDGAIVFSAAFDPFVYRVSPEGGAPVAITRGPHDPGSSVHAFPDVSPDGRTLLLTVIDGTTQHIAATRLNEAPSTPTVLTDGSQPRFLANDLIVFVRDGVLWATSFNAARLSLGGPPQPVLSGVETGAGTGSTQFAVSASGALFYAPQQRRGTFGEAAAAASPEWRLMHIGNWRAELEARFGRSASPRP